MFEVVDPGIEFQNAVGGFLQENKISFEPEPRIVLPPGVSGVKGKKTEDKRLYRPDFKILHPNSCEFAFLEATVSKRRGAWSESHKKGQWRVAEAAGEVDRLFLITPPDLKRVSGYRLRKDRVIAFYTQIVNFQL